MFGLYRLQTHHGTVLGVNLARRELIHCRVEDIRPEVPAAYIYLPESAYGLGFMLFDNPDRTPFAPRAEAPQNTILPLRYAKLPPPPQFAFSHPFGGLFLVSSATLAEDGLGTVAYHSDVIGLWQQFNVLGIAAAEVTPALTAAMAMVDRVVTLPLVPDAWAALLLQGNVEDQHLAHHLLLHTLLPSRSGAVAALGRPDMLAFLERSFPGDPWAAHGLADLRRRAAPPERPGSAAARGGLFGWFRKAAPHPSAAGHDDAPATLGTELDGLASAGTNGGFASIPHRAAVLLRRAVLPQRDLCILSTARNEGPHLLDWIAYHRSVGVDRIVLYSNNNDDGSDELLTALSAAGEITWYSNEVAPGISPQFKAYGHALGLGCDVLDYRWCAAIDLDEYLAFDPGRFTSFKQYLDWQEVRAVDAIALNWLVFGSSGEMEWRSAPVAERFQRRMDHVDAHVKTVFRPQRFHHSTPHVPLTEAGEGVVFRGSDGRPHVGWADGRDRVSPLSDPPPPAEAAWVSHYFFRSAEEYFQKFSRTRGDQGYSAKGVAVPPEFIRLFLDTAGSADQVHDARTLQCSVHAAEFKQGLLAIPTVRNASRLVAVRQAEKRTRTREAAAGLLAAAVDDQARQFYAMALGGTVPSATAPGLAATTSLAQQE